MYQSVPTTCNQPVPITCHNLYQQPVQPTCHKLVSINLYNQPINNLYHTNQLVLSTMYINHSHNLYHHKCINYAQHILSQQPVTSTSSTKSDLFTKINHQDNSQPYAQYHQDVHQPRLLTNINKMYQESICDSKIIPSHICHIIHKLCANNTTRKCL
jgi:hypothetical protein